MSWPSPTDSSSDVSGANGSARRPAGLPASASGMIAFRLQRAAREVAVEEAGAVAGGFLSRGLENPIMVRRQRTGRIGVAGIACQRKSLTAAAAEIDFL